MGFNRGNRKYGTIVCKRQASRRPPEYSQLEGLVLDFQNANSDLIHREVKLTEDPVTTGSGFLVQLVWITQSNARTLVHASTILTSQTAISHLRVIPISFT